MRYDGVWMHFKRVNKLAWELLQSQTLQKTSKPAFLVESAIMSPLFFCGFHCREWTIRRETLRLLKVWEERFGVLNANTLAQAKLFVLERLIEIESKGWQSGDVVPQSARIHFVRVIAHPYSSKVHLSYLRLGLAGFDDIWMDSSAATYS